MRQLKGSSANKLLSCNVWKRVLVAVAVGLAFVEATQHVSVYACTCAGRSGGLFIMNRESDDNTLILPRDARGVLWWQAGEVWQKKPVRKEKFTVRLLSGARERNLDFRVIEAKPNLFLIAPTEKLLPGNRYVFTYRDDTQEPARSEKVEATVENTAFASIKDQVQLWLLSPGRGQLSVVTAGGSCSRSADVVAQEIHISDPAAIERWRFALLFETILDGKGDWQPRSHLCGNYPPGSSWRGYGTDIIFAECATVTPNEVAGTKEGEHGVYMTVSVPGTNLVAITKTHSFRLTCTSPTLK